MKDTKKILYETTKIILILLAMYFVYDIIIMQNGTGADICLYISEFILLIFALLLAKKGSILTIFFTILFGVLIFSTGGMVGKVVGTIIVMVSFIRIIKNKKSH